MQKYFFTTIVIVLVMVTFAVLNSKVVPINFGFTKINISLALTIFIVFAIGALVSFIVTTPTLMRNKKEIKRKNKQIKQLQDENNRLKESAEQNSDEEISGDNAY
ncbi:MAG: LapA family protein [Bacteroidota bacterium]